MTSNELRKKYLEFFKSKGHAIIPSASLIPENDPTVLFTTAGMHPLVPYLMGEKHPAGNRLVDIQKCVRTSDIDDVGDTSHHTFFEQLGNWSLGDYFKKEIIEWSWEFITSSNWLGLDKQRIAVSVFKGDEDAPLDQESIDNWEKVGVSKERIARLSKTDNWWGPAGQTGPCGPNTEIFYWTDANKPAPEKFNPEDKRWMEFWNNVFLEYNKTNDGRYISLSQKNIDTGVGLERVLAIVNKTYDNYKTDLFANIIKKIEELSSKKYGESEEVTKYMRVIADHIRAATFIMGDDKAIIPSNVEKGYILRRLIRRAKRKGMSIGIQNNFTSTIAEVIVNDYKEIYPELERNKNFILDQVNLEEEKARKPLDGLAQYKIDLEEAIKHNLIKKIKDIPILSAPGVASGRYVYENFQSYGTPDDLSKEIVAELGLVFDQKEFDDAFKSHQEKSRTASAGMFKGGLADASEQTIKYHTAAHLMLAALRKALGDSVSQKGANITAERLRFDFSYDKKMTPEQIKRVEDIVNEKIKENLPVEMEDMSLEEAKAIGATGAFESKYGERVKVYTIGDSSTHSTSSGKAGSGSAFSREICGGPHVNFTGEIGKFKIVKEESSSAGVRRIKAIVE